MPMMIQDSIEDAADLRTTEDAARDLQDVRRELMEAARG